MSHNASHGSQTANRMSDGGHDAQDAVHRVGGQIADVVSSAASRAKDYAQQGLDVAAQQGKKYKKSTEGLIKSNPWYAVGIAAGVGLLVGMMMSRHRD